MPVKMFKTLGKLLLTFREFNGIMSVSQFVCKEGYAMNNDQIRIVQETVSGKEITFAHVIGGPSPIIYQKLGLNPSIDYGTAAIGVMNITPSESAIIASDIAVKSGDIYLGFADRFTGTMIITGEIADVETALTEVVDFFRDTMGYVVCKVTKR